MQTLPVRLHTDPDGFFDQADGLLLRDIFDHLQINRSAREDHPLGMQLFLFGKALIFGAQFAAKLFRVIDKHVRLRLAELLSQLAQEIREAAKPFIISLIDHTSMLLHIVNFDLLAACPCAFANIISGISKKLNSDAFDGVFAGCVPHVTAGMKREAVQISSGFVASVG